MTERANSEIVAECREEEEKSRTKEEERQKLKIITELIEKVKVDRLKNMKLAMNTIYKIVDVYEKRVLFFIEPLNDRCNTILID